MFTGIIEEIGSIAAVRRGQISSQLTVRGNIIFDDLKIGDSVAVNGVCLTATSISGKSFTADVMAETLRRTNLGTFKEGTQVNLERAMAADGRFGGHIVSGHIDGTGTIAMMKKKENAVWVKIHTAENIMKYIIEKGSIAIDGISLTVAERGKAFFSVSVIPHTGSETTLLEKREGAVVNLENDVIGKYVEQMMKYGGAGKNKSDASRQKSDITAELLAQNGFI